MSTTTDDGPVVYLMPDGTEVSNDPRFFQQQMQKQLAEQQVHVRQASETSNRAPVPDETGKATTPGNGENTPFPRDELTVKPEPATLPDNIDELKGAELKSLAKDLKSKGVEISTAGVTTVAELRDRIKEGFANYDPDATDPELEDEDDSSDDES